jgi:hypothetical protein
MKMIKNTCGRNIITSEHKELGYSIILIYYYYSIFY